jgi:Family of unknown function (DUF6585)
MDYESPLLRALELGMPRSEHPLKTLPAWSDCIAGILLTGVGIAAVFSVLSNVIRGITPGFGSILLLVFIPGMVAMAGSACGVWLLNRAWKNWGQTVAIFDRGFAIARGDELRQVPWDEVAAVWQSVVKHAANGIVTGTTHTYTIQLTDDTRFTLDEKYRDIEELGKAIQINVTNNFYPRYRAALESGSRLEFGPIALDLQKLYAGKKSLLWNDMQSIRFHGGWIYAKRNQEWQPWANIGVSQIPNFFIFYLLLKNFITVEDKTTQIGSTAH